VSDKLHIDALRQAGKYRVANPRGLPFGTYDVVVIRYVDANRDKHIIQGLRNTHGARWVRSITNGVWGAFAHTPTPEREDATD